MTQPQDFDNTFENKWCPGCGNFGILQAMKNALASLAIEPQDTMIVSGIGQAAKTPHFLRCNYFHGLHGRALPAATGAKVANHKLTIIVNSGDGDCYGEGGNHFLSAIRRNVDLTLLVHNNKVYGLTKGQASPTSDLHMITRVQTHGVILEPFNPLSIALALNAGFVARGYAGDQEHLAALIQAAIRHRGFSLIDILQPCVSFNHVNTYDWYNQRVYDIQKESYDSADYMQAIEKARQWGDKIPIGILYQAEKPSFTDNIPGLSDGVLLDRSYEPAILQSALDNL